MFLPQDQHLALILRPIFLNQLHVHSILPSALFKHISYPPSSTSICYCSTNHAVTLGFFPPSRAHPYLTCPFRLAFQEAFSYDSSPLPLLLPEHCLVLAQVAHLPG